MKGASQIQKKGKQNQKFSRGFTGGARVTGGCTNNHGDRAPWHKEGQKGNTFISEPIKTS